MLMHTILFAVRCAQMQATVELSQEAPDPAPAIIDE